jgi:hypothetical protein
MSGDVNASDAVGKRAVAFFETLRGVSEPEAAEQVGIAGGTLVAIRFKRDGLDTWAWYFEKGEIKRALYRGTELAAFIDNQSSRTIGALIKEMPLQDLIKLTVVSILTFIFAFAVIYIVMRDPENKSLQVLTGLLGLTIGYLVGKVDTPK